MNVPNGSSLGLGFSIFDLDKERDTFSFSHFHHYFRHIHDYALRGVAFNFDDLLFNSSRLLACLNMPSLITL
jgi:hypothetical protein